MEGFRNFTSAMDRASYYSSKWQNCDDKEVFSYAEMMLLAAHLDKKYPLSEKTWYVVFPDGEICMLHEDFDEIVPMFKPLNKDKISVKFTGDEFYPDSVKDEPVRKGKKNFCKYCGEALDEDTVYCPSCGKKVG
ncbi:MAG: zinc ribbon domain-containing protein [Erysipelotrichaceae bacterium]|nr:zinc ribbon domain-containing protein [Erysipelotrichaceae bacterium]